LTHLLSISGLHLTLVAGLIFFLVRGGLALSEWAALRWPLKKLAAAVAIVGAFAYLQISGGEVPTQRSFVMAAMVLLAVLLDRQALSMRSVCWAAAAILLVAPESLLEAGFMMSFAAVVALIAAYEGAQARIAGWRADSGLIRRGALYLGLTAATTLVASAATLPFVTYHFNRFVDFGVISNLIAVPLTSVWVMPWAVTAFLLMPFEAETLALTPMGWGVALVNWLARTVAAWPDAVSLSPVMPIWGLFAASLGGIWLCLWRQRWRWFGLAALAAGVLSPLGTVPPDILIDATGRVAIRAEDGRLIFAEKRKAHGIVAETWNRRMAQDEADAVVAGSADLSADGQTAGYQDNRDIGLHCDGQGCIYRAKSLTIALPKAPSALADDCPGADLVLAAFSVGRNCPDALLVIDGPRLKRGGAHAIWLVGGQGQETLRVEDVASQRGRRLWVNSGRSSAREVEGEKASEYLRHRSEAAR
jgi:competence protein ComEC